MPTCRACGASFGTEEELQSHNQRMHPGVMGGMGREEKKIEKLEGKEQEYRQKAQEHETSGHEWMAERDRKKEAKTEEKVQKERGKETGKGY